MRLLAKVESVFSVPRRGTVIVPSDLSDRVRNGDEIQLRAADGQILNTRIASIESMNSGLEKPRRLAFMLPLEIAKHDVVEEMEIWG
jgi:hypothetical protein